MKILVALPRGYESGRFQHIDGVATIIQPGMPTLIFANGWFNLPSVPRTSCTRQSVPPETLSHV